MKRVNIRWYHVFALILTGVFIVGCDGSDGAPGPAGPAGADGPTGPAGPPGSDPPVLIGNGSGLTEEEAASLGKLNAVITGVTIASAPVVDFTVTDGNGNPAVGITAVAFTIAKLVPNTDPLVNGGLPYWQNYINRVETDNPATGAHVLPQSVQPTTDSGGTLVETAPGVYQYTFGTDVANVTSPIAVAYDPSLTHRVGLEMRLSGPTDTLEPFNATLDFVPDGGAGSGVTRNIIDIANCNRCHYELDLHGGPRKSPAYCVTCHNQGNVDQDTGNSLDFSHMIHSIHMGHDRVDNQGTSSSADDVLIPYIIYGYGDNEHDYSEIHFPQSQTFCETCHTADPVTAPDGDNWNTKAAAKPCTGCHAAGIAIASRDPDTGQAVYQYDHNAADADALIGLVDDGECGSCHLGTIQTAGPPLAIHSNIRGDQRAQKAAGDNFIFEIHGATNVGPGLTPTAVISVKNAAGVPYDILNDPEFDLLNGASLNLYVQWATDAYYGGDENGLVLGARQNDNLSIQSNQALNFRDTAYAKRMRLGAIQAVAAPTGDGSFDVPFFEALPTDFTGDVVIALGGHPVLETTDADGFTGYERALAVSAVFFPGEPRVAAHDSDKCNNCHNRLSVHGGNRNGNAEFCLICHNGDAAVCQSNPYSATNPPVPDDPTRYGECPDGNTNEGYSFGRMVHSIHIGSTTFKADNGEDFSHVHFPQQQQNCENACHKPGLYNTARATARAVSTDQGSDIRVWTDDIATTPTAAVCGVCHTSTAARGHFESQGGQVDDLKCTIVGAECTVPDGSAGTGLPNGQEACAVCHGTGAEFETSKKHPLKPGIP